MWAILSMKKYVENKEEYLFHSGFPLWRRSSLKIYRARLSLANSRLARREYLRSYSTWRNVENVEIIISY